METKDKKNILTKLAVARKHISNVSMKKDGKNSFSNYDYFTPSMVNKVVSDACQSTNIITLFDFQYLPEIAMYKAVLTIVDIDSLEQIDFSLTTEKAEIKGTSETQKVGGTMTYTERYLKQFAFGISENDADLDNNKSFQEKEKKQTETFTEKKKYMTENDHKTILELLRAGEIDKASAIKNQFPMVPEKYKESLRLAHAEAISKIDNELEFNEIIEK